MPAHHIIPTTTHTTAKMVRLNLSSWLSSSSSSSRDEAEPKKLNRRSFAGFSTAASPFHIKPARTPSTGLDDKAAPTAKGMKPAMVQAKAITRSSTSSTTQASEAVAPGTDDDNATSMTALADKISRETAKLEKYLADNGLPSPGFGVDAADDFPRLPEEMQRSRLEIIHATKQLRDLAVGPREGVRWGVQSVSPPAGR